MSTRLVHSRAPLSPLHSPFFPRSDDGTSPVFQKYNKMLHGGAAAQAAEDGATGEGGRVELLTLEFIRKYIKYAKVRSAECSWVRASGRNSVERVAAIQCSANGLHAPCVLRGYCR